MRPNSLRGYQKRRSVTHVSPSFLLSVNLHTNLPIRPRISQLRFLDSAVLQPVCEVDRRRIVTLRDELLDGPVGKQRLNFRTVLVQLAFAGAFWPSDRQAGSPPRAKGFLRPRGDQPPLDLGGVPPPKSRSKSPPKIGRREIDDIYAVSIGYRKSYGGFCTFA